MPYKITIKYTVGSWMATPYKNFTTKSPAANSQTLEDLEVSLIA